MDYWKPGVVYHSTVAYRPGDFFEVTKVVGRAVHGYWCGGKQETLILHDNSNYRWEFAPDDESEMVFDV